VTYQTRRSDLRISKMLTRKDPRIKILYEVLCDIEQRNSKVRNTVAVGINILGLSRATCTGISTCLSATLRRQKPGSPRQTRAHEIHQRLVHFRRIPHDIEVPVVTCASMLFSPFALSAREPISQPNFNQIIPR